MRNLFTHKNIKYLYRLKCEIQELPWEIWTDNDVHDPNYKQKRIQSIGKVMHIQNRIRGYVIAKYGEGELSKEFSEYSFFTIGYRANTFNGKHPIKYTLYFHKIENSISTLVKS